MIQGELNDYHNTIYTALHLQRKKRMDAILEALQQSGPIDIPIKRWARNVTYQYALAPLSAAGSLVGIGGRFNIGSGIDPQEFPPFPALYVADSPETAIKEAYGMPKSQQDGFSPHELALVKEKSSATVMFNGHLENLFDLRKPSALIPVMKVFKKIKIHEPIHRRIRQLGLNTTVAAKDHKQLWDVIMGPDWRFMPAQYDIPANCQIFAQLLVRAGFEGVVYKSIKTGGLSVALFLGQFKNTTSWLELADTPPPECKVKRLDADTYDLCLD